MKFSFSASIAFYLLFIVFWVNLLTYGTQEENTEIITNLDSFITPDADLQPSVNTFNFLYSINKYLRYLIFAQYLTIREILILRKTCREFQILILPNEKKMVMFGEDFCSPKTAEIPLIWLDLKYFLDESYTNAFDKMEIFNLNVNHFESKGNQYAVLTHKKMISWYDAQTPYPKIIFDKTKNELIENNQNNLFTLEYSPPKFWNRTGSAWSIITKKGNVVTGGIEGDGGDSSNVQSQLKNVKIIVSTETAFAALLDDGSIVVWGYHFSRDQFPETQLLQNVKMIYSTNNAFSALLQNGNVLAWGDEQYGGIIPHETQNQLKNVKIISSTVSAFAALLHDGSVLTWGDEHDGGKIPYNTQIQLKNVKMICSTDHAFAALLDHGYGMTHVVAWGNKFNGGEISHEIQNEIESEDGYVFIMVGNSFKYSSCNTQTQFQNVKIIFSTGSAFAALSNDGRIDVWGDRNGGGKIPGEIENKLLLGVKMIFNTDSAFAALLNNGNVVAWGGSDMGGNIPHSIKTQLKNVKMVFFTRFAFVALLDDGSVFAWGDETCGGKIPADIQNKLIKNVQTIFPQTFGFTALCKNGELIEWGDN